jgi:titin
MRLATGLPSRNAMLRAALAIALLVSMARVSPSSAATFTVDDLGDAPDAAPGNGICSTALDVCTLRAAIQEANASAGADTIDFDAGLVCPCLITPGSFLPFLTDDGTIIDASSKFSGGAPGVVVEGLGAAFSGFTISGADDVRISGLQISGFRRGVVIRDAATDAIIGTNADGTTDTEERNVVRDNTLDGVQIAGAGATGHEIAGNYIGVAADGTTAAPNGSAGVRIRAGATTNTVGTDGDGINDAAERNVISGNVFGVVLDGAGTTGNTVAGNHIGTDAAGTAAVPNTSAGVSISAGAATNLVGADGDGIADAAERNVISGNTVVGVEIRGAGSDGNVVAGNYIGPDATGDVDLGNGSDGVRISLGASTNVVGTDGDGTGDAAERNVISGNNGSGVNITDVGTSGNAVAGNYIGLDASTGAADLGNSLDGVRIQGGASANLVGTDGDGTADSDERNFISGNGASPGHGVRIAASSSNVVAGNYIGLDAAGTTAVPNSEQGVAIMNGATMNLIGTDGDGTNDSAERNVISGNSDNGVYVRDGGTTLNDIAGNYIGTTPGGVCGGVGNAFDGVRVRSSPSNTIGTDGDGSAGDGAEGNVVSCNARYGVAITRPGATSNVVAGNLIGVDATGVSGAGNGSFGVWLQRSVANTRVGTNADGTSDTEERNVISDNGVGGVGLFDFDTSSNVLAGNYIGLGSDGSTLLGNLQWGVLLANGAEKNRIGTNGDGTNDAAERNVISDNGSHGVEFRNSNAITNTLAGNFIGTDSAGTTGAGNGGNGVMLRLGTSLNVIGTNGDGSPGDADEGNVISGNGASGVDLREGSDMNIVAGNTIGLDSAGTAALGNAADGVRIGGASESNRVGTDGDGTSDAAERNVISGNAGAGVRIGGFMTRFNSVSGNYIGTMADGTTAAGNTGDGVLATGGSDNLIGSDSDGTNDDSEANRIRFNGGAGVSVKLFDVDTGGVSILRNSIYANGGLGIDLANPGVTPNDVGDGDGGANFKQNFPVITGASITGATVTFTYDLDVAAGESPWRVEFFLVGAVGDPSGNGEGLDFICATSVAAGGTGLILACPTATPSGGTVTSGDLVTATATNDDSAFVPDPAPGLGSTSEFGPNATAS